FACTAARQIEDERRRLPNSDPARRTAPSTLERIVEGPSERDDVGSDTEGRRVDDTFQKGVEVQVRCAGERRGYATRKVQGIGDDKAAVRGWARVSQRDRQRRPGERH